MHISFISLYKLIVHEAAQKSNHPVKTQIRRPEERVKGGKKPQDGGRR